MMLLCRFHYAEIREALQKPIDHRQRHQGGAWRKLPGMAVIHRGIVLTGGGNPRGMNDLAFARKRTCLLLR